MCIFKVVFVSPEVLLKCVCLNLFIFYYEMVLNHVGLYLKKCLFTLRSF